MQNRKKNQEALVAELLSSLISGLTLKKLLHLPDLNLFHL